MNKYDLKTGHILELQDGNMGLVLKDSVRGDVVVGLNIWCTLDWLFRDGIDKPAFVRAIYEPQNNKDVVRCMLYVSIEQHKHEFTTANPGVELPEMLQETFNLKLIHEYTDIYIPEPMESIEVGGVKTLIPGV